MPTHRVPKGGAPAWTSPDPAAAPATHLQAHVELQVVETTGAWARVLASNGWEGWVDGRVLVPAGPQPETVEGSSVSWAPTHAVPAAGASAWVTPDPSVPPVTRLEPGVQLQLIENQGAWARVMGANGWAGWVDGRSLLPVGQGRAAGSGLAAAIGVAAVIGGSFLPLMSWGGVSISAWQFPLFSLIANSPAASWLRTGMVLLIVLAAAVPVLTGRRFHTARAIIIGWLPTSLALFTLLRTASDEPANPGPGLFLILAGGMVVIGDALWDRLTRKSAA